MIKKVLQQLNHADREQLMYAFEQEMAQYVVLDGDIFIGVNVEPLQNLEILETSGVWSYGRIK